MTDVPEFLYGGADTYDEKNDDYGDSWRQVGYIMWMLAGQEPITLKSPQDVISFGLMTRRLDKFARAFNGEFRSGDLNFESTKDAHLDDMVYAAMSASNLEEKEEKREKPKKFPRLGLDHQTVKVDNVSTQ